MYYISLLGFNKFIIVDNSYANFSNFSTKHVSFVSDLVTDEDRNFKLWETLKNEYHLSKLYFQQMQLIHAIPLIWKQKTNDSEINVKAN